VLAQAAVTFDHDKNIWIRQEDSEYEAETDDGKLKVDIVGPDSVVWVSNIL
jgi:hypothetical protein